MEKIKVNDDVCIGCGACAATYPDVFAFNDEGRAKVQKGKEEQENEEAETMVGICPVGAIEKESEK